MTSNIYLVIFLLISCPTLTLMSFLESTAHSASKYIYFYRYRTTTTEVIGIWKSWGHRLTSAVTFDLLIRLSWNFGNHIFQAKFTHVPSYSKIEEVVVLSIGWSVLELPYGYLSNVVKLFSLKCHVKNLITHSLLTADLYYQLETFCLSYTVLPVLAAEILNINMYS